MKKLYETDVFPILNLAKLTANYRLCEMIGLNQSDEEYDNNVQYIVKSLSYSLKHPITVITKDEKLFLVVRDTDEIVSKLPKDGYAVKKNDFVYFKTDGESIRLDFENYDSITKPIITRFLQFDTQSELMKLHALWQPTAGDAFFSKSTYDGNEEVEIYNGFIPRIFELPTKGFGICLDITKKYIAHKPLDVHLTRDQFRKQKIDKCHYIYKYGNSWYEIKPSEFSDLNVSQVKFVSTDNGKRVSIIEDIHEKFKNSMTPEIAKLPDTASVIIYHTNGGEERRVPAALCYRVFDTEDAAVNRLHKKSIVKPFPRRRNIATVQRRFLNNLFFGPVKLEVSRTPISIEKKIFDAPDIEFGNNTILTVRNTPSAIKTTISELGRERIKLLTNPDVGFYSNAPFERQYLILPETVFNTFGNDAYFLKDLKNQVNKMHKTSLGWNPIIIPYDNRNKRTTADIGFEILEKISERVNKNYAGYAVIMLPASVEKNKRKHDELAALVVAECLEFGISASIMHANTLEESFYCQTNDGKNKYFLNDRLKGKYLGYVKGVAINQVLLNNERWPFVLKTPLFADLTIGIDVKRHIAGFTFIDKYSKNILTRFNKSENKERLTTSQVVKMLVENIELQAKYAPNNIEKIVFHRDGKLFRTEKEGILKAKEILINKGILPTNVSIAIIEIPKSSIVPFRIFELLEEFDPLSIDSDNGKVLNPQIGSLFTATDSEAFVCTTGREFAKDGTSIPLYIKCNYTEMDFEKIAEDIYYLSCLAYTKPDDCSRYPLTIKITDRRINTLASDYNSEALELLRITN